MKFIHLKMILVMVFAANLIACGGSDNSESSQGNIKIEKFVDVEFRAMVGDEEISCSEEIAALGTPAVSATISDFRFFVSDFEVITEQGETLPLDLQDNDFQAEGVTLLDFEDATGSCGNGTAALNSEVIGNVSLAEGDSIKGIQFKVGLPDAVNHSDTTTAPSPLNLTALHWNWAAGYKFMRLDVNPSGGVLKSDETTAATFNFHLGPTACNGDPTQGETVSCAKSNRPQVVLSDFDPGDDVVVFDFGALMSGIDLSQDESGRVGCMSFPDDAECGAIFSRLGLSYESGETSGTQSVFSTLNVYP